MVVARSTLCFQSSLRTRASAPRAVSVRTQTHRHRSTQTHNTNPNMVNRRQVRKAAVWLAYRSVQSYGCFLAWRWASRGPAPPSGPSPGAYQLTPNTGLFADKSTTQCDRYKCGSAVSKETGWSSRRGEEPKESRVFLEINERDGLIDADRRFWGRSGSSSTQRNLHVELCTFELQQLEPLCHVKTLKSFGKKKKWIWSE